MSYSYTAINGRLCKDAELRQTQTGKTVATFTVAVDRGYGDTKKTVFYPVVAWNKDGEFVSNHFHKGDGIIVNGTMEHRDYEDKDGNKRRVWELIANHIDFPVGKAADWTKAAESAPDVSAEDFNDNGQLPF